MKPKYIRMLDIEYGASRNAYERETPNHITFPLMCSLEAAATAKEGARTPLPFEGYSFAIEKRGKCLIARIYPDGWDTDAIATIWVGTHSLCASRLWGSISESSDVDPNNPPHAPWAAYQGEPPRGYNDPRDWIADFSEVLAWAWVRYRTEIAAREMASA